MYDFNYLWKRIGVLLYILKSQRISSYGRTKAMKLLYLLQTVRGVSLGYDFRLYTYGPFDAEVLGDLDYAESLGALTKHIVYYHVGYGYNITLGNSADDILKKSGSFIKSHYEDIDWVIDSFGEKNAAELELISTIIYVDRSINQRGKKATLEDLAEKVRGIKPHFDTNEVKNATSELQGSGLLFSIAN